MRRSKYVGFLALALGLIAIVGAAVMPVSPYTQGFGPYKVDVTGNNCGLAGDVAFSASANTDCRTAAHKRLLAATAVGLVTIALGMALCAGPDERAGSRIRVRSPRIRRSMLRNPGSRRYTPS